jgi:undecaprenyl diphosphate synthase
VSTQPAPRAAGEARPADAPARLPRHIAIVMDGNGRWAEQRRRPRSFGHRAGVKSVKSTVEACLRLGIPALTLFAFSSENWARPQAEVSALMSLFLKALDREVDQLSANGVGLRFIGDRSAFPVELQKRMNNAQSRTANNTALALNIAVNYGGRWDVTQACRALATDARDGKLDIDAIDEAAVRERLSLADVPDPDLFIRTGGERRISNFLLWQIAYAELHFSDVLWPDFDMTHMRAALDDFAGRERRYGRTGAQIKAEKHA